MLRVDCAGTALCTVAGMAADCLFLSRRRAGGQAGRRAGGQAEGCDRAKGCQSTRGRSGDATKFLKMME